jgi:hypothetical protein
MELMYEIQQPQGKSFLLARAKVEENPALLYASCKEKCYGRTLP